MRAERETLLRLRGADLILLIPALVLSFHFFSYLHLSLQLIGYPFAIEGNEGVVLQLAYDIARLRPIYRPLTDFPFVPGDYPPVYLLLNAAAIKLFGLNLWSGRLLSFLAAAGIAVVLFRWVYRETRWVSWAVTMGLTPFVSPLFFSRTALYRVDVLAAGLSFLGVYLLAVSKDERGDRFAAGALLLALYTKHSMVAAPAACFLYLLAIDRRRAVRFTGWLVGSGLVLFLLCNIATRQEFFRHLVLYHVMPSDSGAFILHAREFLLWTLPFALCWVVFVPTSLIQHRGRSLAGIYCVTCLVHFVFLRRTGASLHYLLEPTLACFLATGLLLPRIRDLTNRESVASAIAALLLIALLAVQYGLASGDLAGYETLRALEASAARDARILDAIKDRPGEVLAEHPSYALLAGRDIPLSPFHIAQLARAGKFDQAKIIHAIETGRFSLIILNSPALEPSGLTRTCFTDETLAAIAAHYRPFSDRYPGRWLYVPRGAR